MMGAVAVHLNHHIVHARDPEASARWLAEMLGVAAPTKFGPFDVVELDNGVSLDFIGTDDPTYLVPQHYAFLVSDEEFDQIYRRIVERGYDHWADPGRSIAGEINHHDGGKGVYWPDPDDHLLEIITRPYGSGSGS
ncbi:MAG TPA: VOC family protein [Acidimicrobiales bacterium]|nr:VOC family protein [Acidimicrobiales bacterium]